MMPTAIKDDVVKEGLNSIVSTIVFIVLMYGSVFGQADSLTALLDEVEGDEQIAIHFQLIRGLMFDDPQLAEEHANNALELALNSDTDSLLTDAYHFLGLVNYFSSRWLVAINYYQKALNSEWGSISENYQARGFNNIAICYEKIGEYELATENYLKSMNIESLHGNELGAAQTLLNMGILQYSILKPNKARQHLMDALPVLQKHMDKRNLIGCFQNLAAIERSVGNKTLGEAYLDSTKRLMDELGYRLQYSSVYHDYAHACFVAEDYTDALKYYQMAATLRDTSVQKSRYYGDLTGQGKSLYFLGYAEEAEKLLLQAKEGLAGPEFKSWQTEIYENLTRVYSRIHQDQKFNTTFETFLKLNHEQLNTKTLRVVEELNVVYETARKEAEIKAAHQLIHTQKGRFIFIVALSIVILLALIIVLFFRQKLKVAYDELFRSNRELSQRWTHLQKFFSIDATNGFSGETLFSKIMTVLSDEKFYLEADPSLDALVRKLNSNRKYVSESTHCLT